MKLFVGHYCDDILDNLIQEAVKNDGAIICPSCMHIKTILARIKGVTDKQIPVYSVTDANVQIDNPGNVYVYKIDECISALLGCTVAGASVGIDAPDGFCTQKDIKKFSKNS